MRNLIHTKTKLKIMTDLIFLLVMLLFVCCLFIITFWNESCLKEVFSVNHILDELPDYP